MGYHTTPTTLAMRQQKRFQSVVGAQEEAHKIFVKEGYRDFLALTSGRISTKTLRKMGHPFAKNNVKIDGAQRGLKSPGEFMKAGKKGQVTKKGIVRRLPINRQTGRLRRGIRLANKGGPFKIHDLYSEAPHAKHVLALEGTDVMVARGLKGPKGELRKRHQARSQVWLSAVRKAGQKP